MLPDPTDPDPEHWFRPSDDGTKSERTKFLTCLNKNVPILDIFHKGSNLSAFVY
jgi:hypothetical protein